MITSQVRQKITVSGISEPPQGYWSNCIKVGPLLVISGMVGKDESDMPIVGDIDAQCQALFRRMKAFVEAGGGQMNDIIKMNAFIADIRHRDAFVRARKDWFSGEFPPCTVVGGTLFAQPEYLIEVDAWAIVGSAI